MLDSTTKQCSKCGEAKPLSEFYLRKRKGSHTPEQYCKLCHHLMTQKYQSAQIGTNARVTTVKGELQVIDRLKQFGIFAASGKASEYKWTDVVAWGCIPIEVKTATLDKNGQYVFAFSYNQIEYGTQALFIVLVLNQSDTQSSFHVFPSDHSIFYANGKLKWKLPYTPGPKSRSHLSNNLMEYHKDKWWQIDEKRIEISKRLMLNNPITT